MKKWPSIESFRHVYKDVHVKYVEYLGEKMPTFTYTGTVKLHGCNASVVVKSNGDINVQSRKRIITPDDDNYGFARFAMERMDEFREICGIFVHELGVTNVQDVAVFGEWVGPGIQRGVAISQIPERIFVVFGFNNFNAQDDDFNDYYDITQLPVSLIEKFNENNIYFVHQCSYRPVITIDFTKAAEVDGTITDIATQVRNQCPFTKELFNIEGPGEGIVWTTLERADGNQIHTRYSFKTVVGDLSPTKKKTAASIDPEIVNSINECVDIILTERRLEQGIEHLSEMGYSLDVKSTGHFLKWVSLDCLKEEKDTVEENGLEWNQVVKEVNKRARDWFMDRIKPF